MLLVKFSLLTWCSTGELRFELPKPPLPFDGIRHATAFGAACPQQNVTFNVNATLFGDYKFPSLSNVSEDCVVSFTLYLSIKLIRFAGLFINVVRPVNVPSHKLLPIIFVSIQMFKRSMELRQSTISIYMEVAIISTSFTLNRP